MGDPSTLSGSTATIEILGVKLVGIHMENGKKLLFTLLFLSVVILLHHLLRGLTGWLLRRYQQERLAFWTRQALQLATAVVLLIGLVSVWFEDPSSLTAAVGLVTAGLAFALQKVITAIAGYFIILRGKTFQVGDRIALGAVRGEVIALNFTQITLLEIGQPSTGQGAVPAPWGRGRQYTGRIVTVSNATIFDEPIYNYTRDFPYLWEELSLPIPYSADRACAERILLEVAAHHTLPLSELSQESFQELQRRYGVMKAVDMKPKVYYRLTDNWLELTVRFIAEDVGGRALKDAMSREILQALDAAGIRIASATVELVGLPPLRLQTEDASGR
jgi:small-conductance mechanosensitive channel